MTAETSNARWEVVAERQAWYEQQIALAEGQWAAAFLDRWECGDDVPSKEHYVALWLAERAAPPPVSVPLDGLTALDGLVDRIAEAIRDGAGLAEGDPPWERLGEERRAPWRADAKRALSVVKESLTAEMGAGVGEPDVQYADADALIALGWTPPGAQQPAAEAQGGGDVVQRLRGVLQHAKMGNSYLISQDLIHKAIGAITAPPSAPVGAAEDMVLDAIERRESSAPVGVDAPGSRAWMAEVCRAAALSLAAHGVRNDQLSKVADWIAQQPAAVAPTTAECPHDWGQDEAHEDWARCYKCGISRRKPLSQQPAAARGDVRRLVEKWRERCGHETAQASNKDLAEWARDRHHGAAGAFMSCVAELQEALAAEGVQPEPKPVLSEPDRIGLYQGPDDCPQLMGNDRPVAIFPAGSWAKVCDALDSITGSVQPDPKAEARGVVDEGSRIVTSQLLHWGGIPVRVTGTVTTSPGNWPLIDAALATQHQEPKS